jgi:two-component sensor histidine kinase
VAPQTVDDVALVATELAANAVTHAASAFRVSLSRNASHVRIAVEDAAAAYPRPRSAGPNDTSGRGLALVQVLAERWGCDPMPTGKTVWAELALDPNETGLLRT